jgi:hypothetical protein
MAADTACERQRLPAMDNRWQRHTHKLLPRNVFCVCHGGEVGKGFERGESSTGANWTDFGGNRGDHWHTQNGPEPRMAWGFRK